MVDQDIKALRQQSEQMAAAENIPFPKLLALVKKLKGANEFTSAHTLLRSVRERLAESWDDTERTSLAQQHALCLYKDLNLPAAQRHHEALTILDEIGLRDPECRNKETLGQGGAIYKRMWENSSGSEHLHTALAFYRAGWERDAERDLGWCGVNAAYLLDKLAFHERINAKLSGTKPAHAEDWEEEAKALRRDIRKRLPELLKAAKKKEDYWTRATMAEVCFGLQDYTEAGEWLTKAIEFEPVEWERETTARQLADIARLQRIPPPAQSDEPEQWDEAWQALHKLLGDDTRAALESWRGKVGLALSGGGFRAGLFHLGVLARMAECDMLRSVETLSTVSGGSIVGAHYYLKLRLLLQTRHDNKIERSDYIQLIDELISETMAGTEKNLRVRALTNLWSNLKMVFCSGYSRSMRIGELYEKYLFWQVKDEHKNSFKRALHTLLIKPFISKDASNEVRLDTDFKPRNGNWRRRARVPNLMLNTTSLNSGHNWHFTASWMGEPPGLIGDAIDMNERYRRVHYNDKILERFKEYPLAYGVAASSCVPALFEPLPLKGLYPGRTVRLVDGGVHDNQGMSGLLVDDCDFILCSDASGQMNSQADPANGLLGVFWRSDSIFQDRMREAQYRHIKSQADSGALNGLFFIHLRQELKTAPIDYIGSQEPQYETPELTRTRYGVDRELQQLLSSIRTDLDSFTEVGLLPDGERLSTDQASAT